MGLTTTPKPPPDRSSGQILTKNTLLNLGGNLFPVIISLVSIRFFVDQLGIERFGLLSLAWIVIGYFSLFDLGMGRALTKLVAERLDTDQAHEIPRIFGTTMWLMLLMGSLGALVVVGLTPWLITVVLKLQGELASDAQASFLLLAAALPLVILTAGLRGYLEALQRFDLITVVRVPMSIFSYLGPLPVLFVVPSLAPVIAVLVFGRLVGMLIHLFLCLRISPELRQAWSINAETSRQLFSFGGWLTVSAIVGPIMVYMDRFLVGAYLSTRDVAYYATPYELVVRFSLVSGAVAGVLFPAFVAHYPHNLATARHIYDRGLKYLALALLPIALGLVAFAYDGFLFWLGPEFALNSTVILQILSLGMWLNSLAVLPFLFIQASGRPALTAKIHLIELPLYLITLVWFTLNYGLLGVAITWLLRIIVDTIIMFGVGHHLLLKPVRETLMLGALILAASSLFGLMALPFERSLKVFIYLLTLGGIFMLSWTHLFSVEEHNWVRAQLRRRR